ncbi:MAG: restriction endonuclease subunit S [Bacteroidales bacterium]|jgi:type I restriction enzyme S subunit|nr:restriction endonuclease subunit S [Bacteroidales bacterium]
MKIKNKINPGFKPSPLGPIPNDWDVMEFGEFTKLEKGKYAPAENENIKCLELEHFEQGTGAINGWLNSSEQKSTKNIFQKGQVLFGKLRPYLQKYWLAEFNGVCSSEVWVMTSKDTKCNNEFLFRLVQTSRFIQVANVSSGSKMPRADWDYVSSFPFPIPPLPEQQKIAAILSTWDTAISKTKQLINKLKERNRGLQQQLLTGKKRINGFEETRWVKITADSIFKSISTKNNNGNEQLLSVTQDRGAIPRDMLEGRVTMPSGDTNSFKLVEPGDFIISLRSFQGGLEYSEYRGLVSPAYTVLKPIKPIDHDFYKYYFKSYDFIGHLAIAVIGIRDGKQISFDDFCTVKLPNPSKDEQTKIAEVLSAAGNEVKIQEKKLEALKQQKKGLMQKLLTGKIRVNSKI